MIFALCLLHYTSFLICRDLTWGCLDFFVFPLNPNFGGNLRQFLFQQISEDTLEFLEEDIQSQLSTVFPSVIVDSLEVTTNPDYNSITVVLKYSVESTNISDELNITFD